MRQRLFFITAFIAGAAVGAFGLYVYTKPDYNCAVYPLLSSAACSQSTVGKQGYVTLETHLREYIEAETQAGRLKEVAVYFRDLERGPVFEINAELEFSPASLFKVPLMVAYLSLADSNPLLLQTELTYTGIEVESGQNYPPPNELQVGKTYTIQDLLFRLIAYSDNKAYYILQRFLEKAYPGQDIFGDTFREMGIVLDNHQGEWVISVRRYASVFRQLYNASYLSPERSQQALEMLRQTAFAQGLVAGVPATIPVAHKFGELSLTTAADSVEIKRLYDCGIVYFPGNPYLLCVMTRGFNFGDLEKVITQVSEMVYQEVESRAGEK